MYDFQESEKKKTEPFPAECVDCVPCHNTRTFVYMNACVSPSHVFHGFYFKQLSRCVRKSVSPFERLRQQKERQREPRDEKIRGHKNGSRRANKDENCEKISPYAEQMQITNDAVARMCVFVGANSERKLFSISLSCQCEHEQYASHR